MTSPAPSLPAGEREPPFPLTDDGRLRCPKCYADIGARPVVIHQVRRLIRCGCGHDVRVMRMPHAPAPRQRPHLSKKERRRQRARVLGARTAKEAPDAET